MNLYHGTICAKLSIIFFEKNHMKNKKQLQYSYLEALKKI